MHTRQSQRHTGKELGVSRAGHTNIPKVEKNCMSLRMRGIKWFSPSMAITTPENASEALRSVTGMLCCPGQYRRVPLRTSSIASVNSSTRPWFSTLSASKTR